jgi:GAF domain-containing protein
MGRRIAVYGANDEALQLLPLLASHPEIEVTAVFDPQAAVQRRRLALLDPKLAALLQRLLSDDPRVLSDDPRLEAVVDAGIAPPFRTRFAPLVARGLEVLSPLAARLSWGAPVAPVAAVEAAAATDPKRELLQALDEIAAAVDLAAAPAALFARLLEVSIAATGAAGGSLLLREPDAERLGVRAAVGLEPELWPKIHVHLGEGIAGHVWAEGRALAVHGRANPETFELTRERFDVAASLCVPLHHAGAVCGVLNLHHPTRTDLFSEDDVVFGEQLGVRVARIAAHAEALLALRKRALRAGVAAEVARILAERAPLELRLAALCRDAASRVGRGVATLWWREETGARAPGDAPSLRLAASSLAGGALGAAARLAPGEGVDGRVARDREPIFLRRGDRLAYAALPLLAGAKLLGVLSVQPGGDATESGDEEDALREIAAAAASGLDRELRTERAEMRATRGEAVHEATLRLLTESDPDRIAESVASSAALILDAEHAIVRALDPERHSFRVRCHFGGTAGPLDDALAQLDRRLAREALRRRALLDGSERAHGDDDEPETPDLLVAPLAHGGRALGTLAVYGKRAPAGPHFDALDRELLLRLAAVTARALATALPSETPSEAEGERLVSFAHFAQRIDEEIARASASAADDYAFAVVTCRIENWDELPAELSTRIARNTQAAFTSQLRNFDVATRTAPSALCALLPIPGAAASEHVARLARAVAEAVAKDDDDAQRVALGFGYALYAGDGETRTDLLARAAEPRIRML